MDSVVDLRTIFTISIDNLRPNWVNEIDHWFNQVARAIYPVRFPDERQFVIEDVTDMVMAGLVLIIRFRAGFRAVRTFLWIGCHASPIQWRSRFRQLQEVKKLLVNHLENKVNDKMATTSSPRTPILSFFFTTNSTPDWIRSSGSLDEPSIQMCLKLYF